LELQLISATVGTAAQLRTSDSFTTHGQQHQPFILYTQLELHLVSATVGTAFFLLKAAFWRLNEVKSKKKKADNMIEMLHHFDRECLCLAVA